MGTLNISLCIWTLTQFFTSINGMYSLTTTCEFGTAFDGGSCTMTCDTGTPKTEMQWRNGSEGTTVEKINCGFTGTLPSDYTGACPTSTTYTLTINPIDFCRDTWSWQCTDPFGAAVTSNKADLNITVVLSASSLTINLAGSTIECTVICSPAAVLRLYQIVSVSRHDLKREELDSSNACPDAKGMKTILQYDITNTNSAQYYCQATNDLVEINSSVIQYAADSTPETTVSPTSTTEPPDSNVSTTAATNTTTTITSTVIPTTVTENSSQSSIDIQLSVLVPVVSLVVIILIIILVYCVVVSFRNRRAKENERNSKDQFSMNNKL